MKSTKPLPLAPPAWTMIVPALPPDAMALAVTARPTVPGTSAVMTTLPLCDLMLTSPAKEFEHGAFGELMPLHASALTE